MYSVKMSIFMILIRSRMVGLRWCPREDSSTLSEQQWNDVLLRVGFSGLDGSFASQQDGPTTGSVMISIATFDVGSPLLRPRIATSELCESTWTQTLVNLLSKGNIAKPCITILEQTNPEENTYWIVVTLDQPVLRNLSAHRFSRLQQTLVRSKGVLWVTRGAAEIKSDANMILGLTRSIRSENAGLDLCTLDLDPQERMSEISMAELIGRTFKHAFRPTINKAGRDLEFRERNSIIQIPRFLPDVEKNRFITSEVWGPRLESQLFVQEERSLRLELGTQGIPDSIHFEDDEGLLKCIGDDEVEICVKATGMSSFLVRVGPLSM